MRLQQHHFNSQSATAATASSSAVAAPSSATTPSSSSVEIVESSTNSSLNDSLSSSNGVVIGVHPNNSNNNNNDNNNCDSGTLFLVSSRNKRKSHNRNSDSDSHANLGRNQSNQSQQRQRFSMHNMSAAANTLQRLQQQQSSGLGTPILQHPHAQQRTTMYRLSSFNESESPNHHGEPPLVTPTYESIDVQNLVNSTTTSATNVPTAHTATSGVHGYHHTMEHQTSNAYAESSQGTSDGPEGSTGCMSDNPAVTIPDNHRLYPSHGAHHYYSTRTGSLMPMSGMMVPNGMMSHPHHHPLYPPGGYLTRSLHYYHPDSGFYFGGSGCSPTRTSSPPLYHSSSHGGVAAAAAARHSTPTKDEDFDIFNAIFALISLMSHVCCSGSTFILAYFLWRHEQDYTLFWLTIVATLLPSIVVNAISLKWLLNDNHRQNINNNNNNHGNGNGNGNSSSSSSSPMTPNHNNGTILIRRPEIGPCGWMLRIVLHIVLLGPVLRYIDLLRYGVKSWSDKRRRVDQQQKDIGSWSSSTALPSLSTTLPRPRYPNSSASGLPNFEPATVKPKKNVDDRIDYYLLTVAEDRDTSLLSLFNCLMQCTIQMILHTHSLLCHWYFEHHHHLSDYNHNYTEYVQIAVIGISLFEASWSISSYHRALRRASYDKRNLSSMATIVQSLWHAAFLSCRILAISLFLHQFGYWLLPVAIGHWGVMTIWIMHQGTHFFDSDHGHPNPCREYLFNMLIGLIYMFVFINLKDQPTRYKYLAFYLVTFLENLTFSSLWFVRIEDYWWSMRFPLFITVPILFAASIIMMQFYYWLVHPNGRPLFINKAARCC